jgi:hypothetical protein
MPGRKDFVNPGNHRIFRSLLLAVAGLAPVFAVAAGTYTGTAPVASQSDQDRAAALRTALGQAVTQAAKGDANVLKRPEVARALTRAERYARSYTYQPNTAPNTDPKKAQAKFLLVAQFDGAQVDALVHDQPPAPAPAAAGAPPATVGAAAPAAAATGVNPPPLAGAVAETVPAAADAAPTASAGSYRLWFSGLRSAEDYARLVGALGANPEVRALRIEEAHGNVLQARIDARGSLQSLTEALNVSRLAHPTNTKPPIEGVDAVLDFEP